MPCFRCTARQTDPVKGASPWARAVVAGEQVLVCPTCQQMSGWTQSVDHCARCGSYRLVKALGAIACRHCGLESWPEPHATAGTTATVELAPAGGGADAPLAGPGADAGADTAGTVAVLPGQGAARTGPDLSAEVAAALERVLRKATL